MKTKQPLTTYQRLGPYDLAALRKLNEVFAIAFEDPEKHLSNQPSDQYLQRLLSKSDFIAIIAKQEDQVVGGLIAYVLEKYEQAQSEIYLYDLAVDEKYRRQGIARRLILELKEIAKNYSCKVIFVQADAEDTPAILLYQSMGTKEAPFHFDILVNESSIQKSHLENG